MKTTLVQQHAALVHQLCRRAHDPEDASQAVWEKVLTNWERRSPGNEAGWIATVARRELVDRHRKRVVRSRDVPVREVEDALDIVWREELRGRLKAGLGRLPASWSAALVRHYVLGETVGELSLREGVSPSTIKTRLSRGRARLALLLAGALLLALGLPGPERQAAVFDGEKAELHNAEQQRSYNPIGKRDPFRSFIKPPSITGPPDVALQRYDSSAYVLTGVVWGESPKALVRDPEGNGHVVGPGTYIGRNWGKVTAIHQDRLVVTEEYQTIDGELVVLIEELTLAIP